MLRLLKLLVFLAIVGFIGLTGFAYLGDMRPEKTDMVVPVTLDAD
ncbi:hypothetical protein [Oceaniglobus trochenteri]|nr:hypothetical protein [Oceaniglobus trochenteri]